MPLKIINILFSSQHGGMEQAYVDYCTMLHNSNYQVIAILHPKSKIINEISNLGVQIIFFKTSNRYSFLKRYNFVEHIKFYLLIKKIKPDIIIGHNDKTFALMKMFKNIAKLIGVSHSGGIKNIKYISNIICVNEQIKKRIEKDLRIKPQNIFILHNSIKIDESYQVKIFARPLCLGIISRLSPEKNVSSAIESLALLHKNNIESKLIIAGDGPLKTQLEQLVKDLSLTNHVQFLGWIKDKKSFFQSIDIILLPSIYESFGITTLESFKYSTPVISSVTDGSREIIKDSYNGLIYEPNNPEKLTEKIIYLSNNEELSTKITENAFNDLMQRFSQENISKELNSIISKI